MREGVSPRSAISFRLLIGLQPGGRVAARELDGEPVGGGVAARGPDVGDGAPGLALFVRELPDAARRAAGVRAGELRPAFGELGVDEFEKSGRGRREFHLPVLLPPVLPAPL